MSQYVWAVLSIALLLPGVFFMGTGCFIFFHSVYGKPTQEQRDTLWKGGFISIGFAIPFIFLAAIAAP